MVRISNEDFVIATKAMEQPKKIAAKLHLSKGGPIRVDGRFFLVNLEGESLIPDNTKEVYLCTCGASRNKPFCDGSHKGGKSNG